MGIVAARGFGLLLAAVTLTVACGRREPDVAFLCCAGESSCVCDSTRAECFGGESEVSTCGGDEVMPCCENVSDGYYFCNCLPANQDSCDASHGSSTDYCAQSQSGEVGGGSSSSSSGEVSCTASGSCGPISDNCTCGTTCLHLGVGRYICGGSCSTDADCKKKKNPATGKIYSTCTPGLDTITETFSTHCD